MDTTHHSLFARRVGISVLLMLLTTLSAAAAEIEKTVVVRPGASSVDVSFASSVVIGDTYGPQHGQLTVNGNVATVQLDDAFWDVGYDIVHLETFDQSTLVLGSSRVRLIAGRAAEDGIVSMEHNPLVLPAPPNMWQVDAQWVTTIPGLLAPVAYQLQAPDQSSGPSMETWIGDPSSGHATTTSETDVDVEARNISGFKDLGTTWDFYTVEEGTYPLLKLRAHFGTSGWSVQLISADETLPDGPIHTLRSGRNRLRIVRWDDDVLSRAGFDLFINGRYRSEVDTPRLLGNRDERHTITMPVVPGPDTQELIVEHPRVKRSSTTIDPLTRLEYENFDGGYDAGWTVLNGGPLGLDTQDLPGSGDRLEVDLGQLGLLETALIERPVPHVAGGEDDPQGFAMRLWIDPTNVTMPANSSVRVATACNEVDNCGAARIWLGHDGTSYTIAATAWRNGSPGARIEVPVSNAPHSVTVKLRHGWLPGMANGSVELWIDGELKGEVTDLDNHASQVVKVRVGTMRDVDGSAGIIGLDDYEAWRFD